MSAVDSREVRRRSPVPASDTATVVSRLAGRWEALRDARVFVTGGTGFVGTWLLAALCAADRTFALNLRVIVLTRDPDRFARRAPELAGHTAIELLQGDVRDFAWPRGALSHVVHGAASSEAALATVRPADVREIIVDGTRRVLELCRRRSVRRLLALSSGAVYERPSPPGRPLAEDDPLGPTELVDDAWAYHRAKRSMEALVRSQCGDAVAPIARLFAFVGPGLPLGGHFAAGNFVADARRGGPVVVNGDGAPVRTYLYAADMAAWLVAALVDGLPGRAYNVGAERAVSIAEVARLVAAAARVPVEIRGGEVGSGGGGEFYVPDTRRARSELGVAEWTSLDVAIDRWLSWERSETA